MLFKKGDKVYCSDSEEIEQPMEIVGRNTWFTDEQIVIYYVKGKHKKKGNELIISINEGRLYANGPIVYQ